MDRRGFVGSIFAGLAGVLMPWRRKAKEVKIRSVPMKAMDKLYFSRVSDPEDWTLDWVSILEIPQQLPADAQLGLASADRTHF